MQGYTYNGVLVVYEQHLCDDCIREVLPSEMSGNLSIGVLIMCGMV